MVDILWGCRNQNWSIAGFSKPSSKRTKAVVEEESGRKRWATSDTQPQWSLTIGFFWDGTYIAVVWWNPLVRFPDQ